MFIAHGAGLVLYRLPSGFFEKPESLKHPSLPDDA
jgi:hypothetical protein